MSIRQIDWDIAIGETVRIYRNLNNGQMSIQKKIEKSWKVIAHVKDIVLENAIFYVSETGRQRVIRDKRKNVHAWSEAKVVGESIVKTSTLDRVHYCPYRQSHFTREGSDSRLDKADLLIVIDNQVYCSSNSQPQLTLF